MGLLTFLVYTLTRAIMSHMRSSSPSMFSSWEAEHGVELGIRAMASTSSMLQTSILLYTYLQASWLQHGPHGRDPVKFGIHDFVP